MSDIRIRERTFYLVAEAKEDMCLWVWNICHVCGFRRAVENTGRRPHMALSRRSEPEP